MGVKLQNLVIRKEIEFTEIAGKIVAFDAPTVIMSLFNFARKNSDGLKKSLAKGKKLLKFKSIGERAILSEEN